MTRLTADNLTLRVNQDGEIVAEPGYITYLREQGYTIESVEEAHSVPSESSDGKAYLVVEVTTYRYPRNHPKLDYAEHDKTIRVCSCWAWRNHSNAVDEGEPPGGQGCKHTREVWREEKAKSDPNQEELGQ